MFTCPVCRGCARTSFPALILYTQISQISKGSIFVESRISTFYQVVAPVKLWHGHTSCGARYKTKTMLQVRHLFGSFCALRTSHFDINKNKKCMEVLYHIATNYWCCVFPWRSGFQENVDWKDNHVIDIMTASESGLCLLCSGFFWRFQFLIFI